MILRYATNLRVAKDLYEAAKPKLQGDENVIDNFVNEFDLPQKAVPLAGTIEALAAGSFALSFLNKNVSRLGSLLTLSVLSVAALKHFQAGHGKEGADHALRLMGLASLSFADTFCEKNNK
ncbi:hypothetical protein [Staphylococcus auricularis]|uniref:hypothetical protein n=1 Tax=Staphylococcus auricularis TaxID=29379 RepID=UPI00242F0B01|nr:hypothetical protein [Staphylococcus auricularis]